VTRRGMTAAAIVAAGVGLAMLGAIVGLVVILTAAVAGW
jgi:hypothetical protein